MLTRRNVVLAAVVAALVGLLTVTRTWVSGVIVDPVLGSSTVGATGTALVPALLPIGLAALFGALAASIARGLIRAACGVLVALAGIATAWLTARVLTAPGQTFTTLRRDSLTGSGAGADTIGAPGSGSHLHSGTLDSTSLQAWPWAGLLAAVVLLGCGLVITARGRRWSAAGERYDRAGRDRVRADTPPPSSPAGQGGPSGTLTRRTDAGVDWDRLSLGEDPTDDPAARGEKPAV